MLDTVFLRVLRASVVHLTQHLGAAMSPYCVLAGRAISLRHSVSCLKERTNHDQH